CRASPGESRGAALSPRAVPPSATHRLVRRRLEAYAIRHEEIELQISRMKRIGLNDNFGLLFSPADISVSFVHSVQSVVQTPRPVFGAVAGRENPERPRAGPNDEGSSGFGGCS